MNLYGSDTTYIITETNLTPKQIADKVDIAYMNITANSDIFALNVVMDDAEIVFQTVFSVPEGKDPHDYATNTILPLLDKAVKDATITAKVKVATPMREPAGV